jgi:hypothetical protein
MLPKGVFITITPRFEAAGMSTLSTPIPARPITLRFVAAARTFSVTFVAELSSDRLPEFYMWKADAYRDYVNSFTLFRGVAELDNGNLLVTSGTGVQQVTRTGLVVATHATGSEFRYITRVTPPAGRDFPPSTEPQTAQTTETRTHAQILADERGEEAHR